MEISKDLRVFVVGGGFQYIQMFDEAGFQGGRGVNDCDIVCFTGGEDVTPSYYGEKPMPRTGFNPTRDASEAFYYGEALALKKPMIGICRGSQFLNVMNGGKLWQDVNNHAIGGGHDIIHVKTGEIIEGMTSTHHQMMRPTEDAEIIAVAALSTIKLAENETVVREKPVYDDIEAVWYDDTLSLCFQPHPEFKQGTCRSYFMQLVSEYVIPAT
jgi:gamma-glutamyl-gamma-aminobutyrate hydrolase PuuD